MGVGRGRSGIFSQRRRASSGCRQKPDDDPTYHASMSMEARETQTSPANGDNEHVARVNRPTRVIRDVAELASVRDAWLRMQTDDITADPDFFEAALRADPRIVRPHVVVLEQAGEPVAMLVARIEQLELTVRAGYRDLYAPRVRSITVVYGGVLGDVDEPTFRLLLESVRESLAQGEADIAIFRYLPLDSLFYRIASTEPSLVSRQHVPSSEIHWEFELPDSSDTVLGALSSSSRQKTRRYMRKFETEYEGRFALRIFTDPAELDEFFEAVEQVAAKTYQRAIGVSFGDTPAHRERTLVSMRKGWFRGYVVTVDGRAVAFHHGELYRNRFRLGRPGYDPELAEWRLGTYLLVRLLEDLCQDPDARVLDYGVGDAEYKSRFGTRSWREGNVHVYAKTFRGIRVNLTRTVLLAGVGAGKRVFDRGDVARSLKQRWRRRLRQDTSA
jgi:CelD/BcsL family acetyltransferase involved in cellulose biosynthesis